MRLVFVLIAGCGRSVVSIDAPPTGARAGIIGIATQDRLESLEAFDLGGAIIERSYELSSGSVVTALYYEETLADLRFVPGALSIDCASGSADATCEPLPLPAFARSTNGEDWSAIDPSEAIGKTAVLRPTLCAWRGFDEVSFSTGGVRIVGAIPLDGRAIAFGAGGEVFEITAAMITRREDALLGSWQSVASDGSNGALLVSPTGRVAHWPANDELVPRGSWAEESGLTFLSLAAGDLFAVTVIAGGVAQLHRLESGAWSRIALPPECDPMLVTPASLGLARRIASDGDALFLVGFCPDQMLRWSEGIFGQVAGDFGRLAGPTSIARVDPHGVFAGTRLGAVTRLEGTAFVSFAALGQSRVTAIGGFEGALFAEDSRTLSRIEIDGTDRSVCAISVSPTTGATQDFVPIDGGVVLIAPERPGQVFVLRRR